MVSLISKKMNGVIMKIAVKVKIGNDEYIFGKGVVTLMQKIEELGSMNAACKDMNMSTSKAWKILHRAQEDLGVTLIKGEIGGVHGGRSVLTTEGKELLKRFNKMNEEIQQEAINIFGKFFKK